MTRIQINKLILENFKCHRNLELDFGGQNVAIYGDNAAGKTSVYDALTWLLFGKDSAGNGEKNIEVMPLDAAGVVADHEAITAVEAVLAVDGEAVTLRRTYKEVWSTKRGSSMETFDGHTSEYYIDGVPCKKNAFDSRIREIVPEDTFRLLTSVSYFAQDLHWQKRRAVLFDIAGTMTDREIMETDDRFSDLSQTLGKLSLDDYRKKLTAERKQFTGVKTDVPARISECQKTIDDIQGLDFDEARVKAEELQSRINGISEQIVAVEHNNAAEQKRMEIREAQLELKTLESENSIHRANQSAGTVDIDRMRYDLAAMRQRLERMEKRAANDAEYVSSCSKSIDRARAQWVSVNGEVFTGSNCASCGQILPVDKLQAAKEAFESRKQKRLREIEESAGSFKEAKTQAEERVKQLHEEIEQLKSEIRHKEQEISNAEANTVTVTDMEGYADRKASISARINTLSGELADMVMESNEVIKKLRNEKAVLQADLDTQMMIINKESLLEYARKRIEELREDAKNAAECLESIEGALFLLDEFTRYKTRFVEDSINNQFRAARFRLFREQANGGIEERCDVVFDGVPYMGLNNGAKINVGIDIINTLSRHYGVAVPLFVDNAESVTNLEYAATQMIRLVVSESDKKLRCVHEG